MSTRVYVPGDAAAMSVGAESVAKAISERIAAGGLAGLGAAQFQHVPAGRLAAEIMVEGKHTVNFGAR